jgi:hypothetical protein
MVPVPTDTIVVPLGIPGPVTVEPAAKVKTLVFTTAVSTGLPLAIVAVKGKVRGTAADIVTVLVPTDTMVVGVVVLTGMPTPLMGSPGKRLAVLETAVSTGLPGVVVAVKVLVVAVAVAGAEIVMVFPA